MKKIIMISVLSIFLIGCGSQISGLHEGLYKMRDEYMSLDEAIVLAYRDFRYYSDEACDPCLRSLRALKKQATSEKDKAIIDRKISEHMQWRASFEQEREEEKRLKRERVKQERLERERLERERAERERIGFETKIKELIQNSNGTLRDKSAQQVKKLVDSWQEVSWLWPEKSEFSSIETFYKVFGQPDRKQFLSEKQVVGQWMYDSIVGDVYYYYFLYGCKDGTVRIKVNAHQLDDNGVVVIEDLNIF